MEKRQRAKTIKLYSEEPFYEEPLPQQTLLHVYFIDNSGYFYRWTPRIRGGEVERIFFKMLEVEEKNSPEGAWSEELRKAAEQIPSLKDFKLPVMVECSGLAELEHEEWRYRIEITIAAEKEGVGQEFPQRKEFSIGRCTFSMNSIADAISSSVRGRWKLGVSKVCEAIYVDDSVWGVSFYVLLGKGHERPEYQIIAREVAGAVRSHIRKVLLDFKAIEKGFTDDG